MAAESEVSLTVAAVARRLGVAPATLRTWDRRYGLGPSAHTSGAHRRYSPQDVARLMTMRRLTLDGVAPSEAARSAIGDNRPTHAPSEAEVLDAYADAEIPADPGALVGAARLGDNAAVRWMLARVHPRDPLEWYSALVRPAMAHLATTPALENAGDSACHRLEASAYAELRSRTAALAVRAGESSPAPLAVVVTPVGAGTDLEAHVLAGALATRGVRAAVLVGGSPAELARAVQDVGVQALVIHVGDNAGAALELVDALGPSEVPVFWQGHAAAPADRDVHRVRSLAGACHEVVEVVA
ncbi:MAG TPA: MerR family transcriptional regulator [Actinotalea sp.]|nr:MerR family transcriptional regulator [Actinotalea sp.]